MSGVVGPKKVVPPSTHSALAGMGVLSGEAPAAQHTQGPWEVHAPGCDGNDSVYIEIHDGFGRTATVYGEVDDPETIATANVIAAAPELLAALETARAGLLWYRDSFPAADSQADDEAMEQIDAAIAKASGSAS